MSEPEFIITKEMKRDLLWQVIENAKIDGEPHIVNEAVQELNAMYGNLTSKEIGIVMNGGLEEVRELRKTVINEPDNPSNTH